MFKVSDTDTLNKLATTLAASPPTVAQTAAIVDDETETDKRETPTDQNMQKPQTEGPARAQGVHDDPYDGGCDGRGSGNALRGMRWTRQQGDVTLPGEFTTLAEAFQGEWRTGCRLLVREGRYKVCDGKKDLLELLDNKRTGCEGGVWIAK